MRYNLNMRKTAVMRAAWLFSILSVSIEFERVLNAFERYFKRN